MSKDTESVFLEILKAVGYLFAGTVSLFGYIFESIGSTVRRRQREREQEDQRRALGIHIDTDLVAAKNLEVTAAAGFPDLKTFMETFYERYVDDCAQVRVLPVPPIQEQLVIAAGTIYADENLYRPIPKPQVADAIEEARYRDRALECLRKQSNPETLPTIIKVLMESQKHFATLLPKIALQPLIFTDDGYIETEDYEPGTTVPLLDVVNNIGDMINALIYPLFHPKHIEAGLFKKTRDQLEANLTEADHVDAREHKGSPKEIVEAYLKNTELAPIFDVSVPFAIPERARFEHTHVIGGTGHGKTQLLQHLILNDLNCPNPPALVIVDSQNQMLRKIARLSIFAPDTGRLANRLMIIDPEDDFPPALNMFNTQSARLSGYSRIVKEQVEASTIELFNYIFGALDSELTSKQGTAFAYITRLILSIPGATMETLLELMEDAAPTIAVSPFRPHIERLDPVAQAFFQNQFFNRSAFGQTKQQIARRLYGVLQVPAFTRMFAAKENRLDLFTALQEGKIILVNTSHSLLKDASPLFGRYMIARVLGAAFERVALRDESQYRPAFLFIDEAQAYLDEQFESLLTQARKYKLGCLFAHQTLHQLGKFQSIVASNTSIKLAGGVSDKDAKSLAPDMRTTNDFITSMKKHERSAEFACHIRNYTDTAVRLTIPFGTLEATSKTMTDNEYRELLARNRMRYAPSPDATPAAAPGPNLSSEKPTKSTPANAMSNALPSPDATPAAAPAPNPPSDKPTKSTPAKAMSKAPSVSDDWRS